VRSSPTPGSRSRPWTWCWRSWHLSQFTTELAEDAPFLVAHVQAELGMAIAQAENARILNTFNATSGIHTGTGATTAVVDVVADAIAAAEAFSGKTPTAVVAHPNVVAALRKAKASTAGSYMVDPTAPGPSTLHGVPLISTPATAAAAAG
jgi:HK97 family phage major capsid protein